MNNRGSEITLYELWMDDGFGTTFTKVDSYTDNSMEHTIDTNLESGKIYTFKTRCMNSIDYSDFSIEVRFAITRPPLKPE